MKSIALLALVASLTFAAHSKEVNLLCNGKESFYSTNAGEKSLDSSIEELKNNVEENSKSGKKLYLFLKRGASNYGVAITNK